MKKKNGEKERLVKVVEQMYICVRVCVCNIYSNMYTYCNIYSNIYVDVYVCIYMYIHTHIRADVAAPLNAHKPTPIRRRKRTGSARRRRWTISGKRSRKPLLSCANSSDESKRYIKQIVLSLNTHTHSSSLFDKALQSPYKAVTKARELE